MSIILFPHGGSYNHGCEAIVKSTASILKKYNLKLYSMNPSQDIAMGLDRFCSISNERKPIKRFSIRYIHAIIRYYFLNDKYAFEKLSLSPILDNIRQEDFLFSIGGDNYCYGEPTYIYLVNNICRNKGIKTFLWGASIEPDAIDKKMFVDLKEYTHIFARESITYETLLGLGLLNVSLYPDPAFQLKRLDLPLPKGFLEGNTVGINVSPLIISKEKIKGITYNNYISLIKYIIEKTDMQIALIPHVVWAHDNDMEPLSFLYDTFKHTGRVVLINNHTAEELKGFIARCRFMIAARTHASIAAYSQKVPTLVIGYSIKAKGIAKDLFGDYNNYVIPVQNLQNPLDLVHSFSWLIKHELEIKDHYESILENYISKTDKMSEIIK